MNTKFKSLLLVSTILVMVFLSSCEKVAKPVISDLVLGLGNNHVAYIGADLHIEADIEAEGTISMVSVEIHQEEGSSEEIEVEYDEFEGLKNTTFHKHVDIPETAGEGIYHFHLTVTDMEGYQTTIEEEISIEELIDAMAPELAITDAPDRGTTFINGGTISISGSLTDNVALEGLFVALVYESDNIADEDVTGANTKVIVMLHTHDFEDPDEADFTASIQVGATSDNNMTPAAIEGENAWKSGNYYILVKSTDAKGNWVISDHYPIVINL